MIRRLFLAFLLLAVACGETAQEESAASVVDDRPAPIATTTTAAADEEASVDEPQPGDEVSELAERTRSLGSALLVPSTESAPTPVGLDIDSLDITSATVVDVGVEPNGEMEIPGANEIGWYRFGPTPGAPGSAVLAAHIAYNGRDGVFRNLDDIEVGAVVEVAYDDGSTRRFEVTETAQYAKDELPFDRVFSKEGVPTLTLITCGGDFNRSLNSYADNVVVYAQPLEA